MVTSRVYRLYACGITLDNLSILPDDDVEMTNSNLTGVRLYEREPNENVYNYCSHTLDNRWTWDTDYLSYYDWESGMGDSKKAFEFMRFFLSQKTSDEEIRHIL